MTRSKTALINRNETDNPTVFVQVEETNDGRRELISDLAESKAEIKELRDNLEDILAFIKRLFFL